MTQKLDREVLVRYILGESPDPERLQLEDYYIRSEEVLGQLLEAEDDLIDEYARNELSSERRELFEKQFLASPAQAERIAFAQALAGLAPVAEGAASGKREALAIATPETFRPIRRLIRASLAAGVLVAAATGLWFILRGRERPSRPGSQSTQASQTAPVQEPAAGPTQAALPTQPNPGQTLSSIQGGQEATVSVVLVPLVRRAETAKSLVIGPQIERLLVRLQLDHADYARYRALVQTGAEKEIWRQDGLEAHRMPSGQFVVLSLPAKLFTSQDYRFTLSGMTSEGYSEEIAGYLLRVRRR